MGKAMTHDVEALIARLRSAAKWAVAENDHFEPELGIEAADALDALLAERDAITAEREADLRALLTALGLGTHARPYPAAEVFKGCLREIARLREGTQC